MVEGGEGADKVSQYILVIEPPYLFCGDHFARNSRVSVCGVSQPKGEVFCLSTCELF